MKFRNLENTILAFDMDSYLNMIRVYLMQELPPPYNNSIEVNDRRIMVLLPETGRSFNKSYELLNRMIVDSIGRVRNLQHDLDFSIWTPHQLRDFTISKTS